ncbi:MAG: DUF1501 domain-containing protein [Pirellula sp.]
MSTKRTGRIDPLNLHSRRSWLQRSGCGFGWLGLQAILAQSATSPRVFADGLGDRLQSPLAPREPHFPARAKRVVWIFVNGGPSHVDTWDYKPGLEKADGKSIKEFDASFSDTTGFFRHAVGNLMKSPFAFTPRGKCGKMVSSIFPNLGEHVDKMAFIHSGYTESNNHSPALFAINTGMARMGFPCVGSWVAYGLGSETQDLPAFLVMSDPKGRGLPKGHAANWSAGFLPGVYQGTYLKPSGDAIENLKPPVSLTTAIQRQQLDALVELNPMHLKSHAAEGELAARIESFELAFRMQSKAPETLDLADEPEHIHKLYGIGDPKCDHFARQCLMTRRFLERGVRFVQIYSGGMENERSWDGHVDIAGNHQQFADETDRPVAGLLADLEQRGMLDDTLVIWCGEFGRLPIAQLGGKPGRDHNPHCFTAWLAGGGVQGGTTYGASDEVGYKAAVDRVHLNDLHATLLHLLGLDHQRLTYPYNGRNFRLTDVAGEVIHKMIS